MQFRSSDSRRSGRGAQPLLRLEKKKKRENDRPDFSVVSVTRVARVHFYTCACTRSRAHACVYISRRIQQFANWMHRLRPRKKFLVHPQYWSWITAASTVTRRNTPLVITAWLSGKNNCNSLSKVSCARCDYLSCLLERRVLSRERVNYKYTRAI